MSENTAEGFEALTVIEGGKGADVVELSPERSSLLAGSKPWAHKVRKRARELSETLDHGYLELARILYQVYDTPIDGDSARGPIYTAWGFQTFGDYAERELGLHKKKAERLRLIWFTLEVQLKDMEPELKTRIANLGYSKVRELVRVVTLRNAEMWVEQAENMTYRQLYQAVIDEKRAQGVETSLLGEGGGGADNEGVAASEDALMPELSGEDSREVFKQKRFDLAPAQLENVSLALKRCSEMCGSDKEGHLLDLICTDFLATNDVMKGDLDKRLRYLAKIERALGLNLVAVDPNVNEVVYGVSALEKFVGGES